MQKEYDTDWQEEESEVEPCRYCGMKHLSQAAKASCLHFQWAMEHDSDEISVAFRLLQIDQQIDRS